MIYVAVVTKLWNRSGWPDGHWACFVDKNKVEVIDRAMRAQAKWEAKGGYGPYQILVGTLTEEAVPPPSPAAYRLLPITEDSWGPSRGLGEWW